MNHNWNADLLLTQVDTPIRFHLYGCFLDLINISTNDKEVWGSDSDGEYHRLRKTDILLACPVDVQRHIKTDASITNPQLKQRSLFVSERKLESVVKHNIVLFTRGNHVICGELQAFDKYHLFMRVGNKVVLVYRHGLSDFKKEKVPSQIKTNDLRELRKEKHQEWVEPSQETVLRTEDDDRNEVRNKKHPERVEANYPKKEKVPSQTKINDLHELRKIREKWVEANHENGFEEGIKNLLTDLYPDNAHFIYELLQNAEDAGASEVRFILTNDQVEFEHNGNRLFSAKDVEAITSIGFSNKRDDPTKIGKFGIGFKAVFAYTVTPEIESGEYHFQIRDMVVPDTEGLAPGALGKKKTRFVFSFNNPKKSQDKARAEIEKNLRQLNENTLLFLSNIRKIEYHLPDDSGSGSLERREREQDRNRIEISVKHPEDLIPNSTHYLRFEKIVSVRDEEDGELKDRRIAVAFGMEQAGGRSWKITPLNPGQVCIYFPAVKETSNLRFHLHAPFASTVARDSVRECRANTELLKHLATLIAESMSAIRGRGLLNVEFLAVLPNDMDNLSIDYLPIQEQLIKAFNNEKLTPMKEGGHAAASGIYRGESQLSNLIQDEDLARLIGKSKSAPLWVAEPQVSRKRNERGQFIPDINAQRQNERISNFLTMLNISEWETENLVMVLDTQSDMIIDWLWEKSDEWHQRLYVLLGIFLSSAPSYPIYVAHERKDKLLPLSIVRCKDSSYRTGGQCHFPTDDLKSDGDLLNVVTGIEEENQSSIQEDDEHKEEFHYVAKGVYSSGQNKDQQEKAREFLKAIGVREVDEAAQVQLILRQRYVKGTINLRKPHHKRDLERFIALVDKEPDKASLFNHYYVFELDNGHWGQPSNHVFVDSPYLNTGLKTYYEAIGEKSEHFRRAISLKYTESDIDPERLGKFAKEVGAQTKFDAIKQEIPDNHPERQYLIDSAEGQWRYTGNNEDYIITEFKTLLDTPSIDKSRLIWRTMCSLDESHLESWFWNNKRYMNRRPGKSSLVHDLRNAEWVPQQKNGTPISFVLPRKASIEHLPAGFQYETEQKWLQAIEFGEIARVQKEEYSQQNQRAQEMGFNSGDEAETMAEIAQAWRLQGKAPEEMLDRISADKRRTERLTIQLSDAEEKQYEIRARSIRSTRSTIDPHTPLRQQYTKFNNMECQMCRQEMPFKKRNSDDDYFEAVEAFGKDYFPKEHEAQHLALCPECAAKYKEYIKKNRAARNVLYNLLKDSNEPEVRLELNDLAIRIWFDEKHWHDLKTVLHYYENIYNIENSTD